MIKSSIEQLSESIGFDIGKSDDITQANLLNGFSKAMANSMNDRDLETQVCYIADKLTPQSIRVITKLNDFIKLKQDGRK